MQQTKVADSKKYGNEKKFYVEPEEVSVAADPVTSMMSKAEIKSMADRTQKAMEKAAKELDFMEAARLRDELKAFKALL
jgi:excinuclease ABC subunit B